MPHAVAGSDHEQDGEDGETDRSPPLHHREIGGQRDGTLDGDGARQVIRGHDLFRIETDMGGISAEERGNVGGAGQLVVAAFLDGLEMGTPDADALLDLSQVQTARLALIA